MLLGRSAANQIDDAGRCFFDGNIVQPGEKRGKGQRRQQCGEVDELGAPLMPEKQAIMT